MLAPYPLDMSLATHSLSLSLSAFPLHALPLLRWLRSFRAQRKRTSAGAAALRVVAWTGSEAAAVQLARKADVNVTTEEEW